jgi:ribosome-associated protein
MRASLVVAPGIEVPASEIRPEYSRSSGPGGQNVNKVESRVTLRYRLETSAAIPSEDRARMIEKLKSRLTKLGEILVSCDSYRDRGRNEDEAFDRLEQLLQRAYVKPRARKKTKPSRGSKERRLKNKKQTSARKAGRRRPDVE